MNPLGTPTGLVQLDPAATCSAFPSGRLGKLASVGTIPAPLEHDARAILAGWAGLHDADTLRQMSSGLHANLATGLIAGEKQLDDVDAGEPLP